MNRNQTREIQVRDLTIGHQNKVILQSMTNTRTSDIEATIAQILQLEEAGCQMVRMAVIDEADALAIPAIKARTNIPLVADIHFDYRIAIMAIDNGIDKIRLNPGNIGSRENVEKVVHKCKEKKIPIRIGINSGSIEKDLLVDGEYVTKEAMIESARRHVQILEDLDFYDICLSFKASDVNLTIDVYRLASETFPYPLHLGVTEAGTFFTSSIKSAIAIGSLLHDGIGDTIRVSVSDEPKEEMKIAKAILRACDLYDNQINLISCPTCGRTQWNLIPLAKKMEAYLETIPHNITVAIMGCAVNGPGEARHADIGIAGGKQEGLLFKKGKVIRKIKEAEFESVIKEEIALLVEERRQQGEKDAGKATLIVPEAAMKPQPKEVIKPLIE